MTTSPRRGGWPRTLLLKSTEAAPSSFHAELRPWLEVDVEVTQDGGRVVSVSQRVGKLDVVADQAERF